MIGGNHEVPRFGISPSLAIDVLGSAGIATVFSRSDAIQKKKLNIHGKKVIVAGRSYYTQFESANPLKNVEIPVEGDFNILMIHGSLQGLEVSSSVLEMVNQNPFKADDIKSGLNYLALGHFHNFFEREYLGCKIVNPGSIEKLSIAEINDEKGFVWAEVSKSEVKTNFIKLKTRPMETAELTLSKDENYLPNIREFILNFLSKLSKPNKILKVSLRGLISQQQYGELKINELLAASKDLFFWRRSNDYPSLKGRGLSHHGRCHRNRIPRRGPNRHSRTERKWKDNAFSSNRICSFWTQKRFNSGI
jgi:DNA repair exonuclease SbcCD nuclease subunit